MARRSSRRLVVPDAHHGVDQFKAQVMRQQGVEAPEGRPDLIKYAVAQSLGIPLSPSNNGNLTTEQAGKIGGQIGGAMVREMIKMAQQQLAQRRP
ncbi:alpha/beta-type small acid-soluble spore protein [Paenibacillus thalictri]|uniref:Alpha/beta-type small acid-soluble spore protein n=1 Tax=Paenibacillus thalictri TaxID=2527873 RepID=A0A4Q9DDW4_9BACL|nr:alpha/beta-type small acid-soluble spore protein [Paenibacillus thalictri]TBL67903.1 alpha/beta-type small acid-soluble spore protein [Paenibacillus thalictri]